MYEGVYKLADVPVLITSLYDEVHKMCAQYSSTDAPQLHFVTTAEDIEAEGRKSDEERHQEGLPEYHFPAPYLETLAVYRKLATELTSKGILLIHGSVIAVDEEGFLFTAKSGTGKSTHVRLWRELFGERAMMVNDDKPLIKVRSENPHSSLNMNYPVVFGTPWDGKHHLSTNICVPLKAIVHLERGEENHIEPLSPAEMLPVLLQQTFRPQSAIGTMQVLQLLDALSQEARFYRLHCNMQPEAARIAYEGMNGLH